MIDTLAKRYGWFYQDIAERMYWEDVYEMFEQASNYNVLEKNADMKFQYMLHATTKKALNSWKDSPLPYPLRTWQKAKKKSTLHGVFGKTAKRVTASDEQKRRFEEVSNRMAEHKRKVLEFKEKHYLG